MMEKIKDKNIDIKDTMKETEDDIKPINSANAKTIQIRKYAKTRYHISYAPTS